MDLRLTTLRLQGLDSRLQMWMLRGLGFQIVDLRPRGLCNFLRPSRLRFEIADFLASLDLLLQILTLRGLGFKIANFEAARA